MIRGLLKKFVNQDKYIAKKSYSQSGEDLIVDYLRNWKGFKSFNYLDIGAYHPFNLNNTYLFYKLGFRGMNIDGNLSAISLFNKYRKDDVNLNLFISDKIEKRTYFEFSKSAYNTIDETIALENSVSNKIIGTKEIFTTTVNEILINYKKKWTSLDFLSIDCEGLDLTILKNMDFDSFSPKIICVETIIYSDAKGGEKNRDILDFLTANGFVLYSDTFINSIFVQENIL